MEDIQIWIKDLWFCLPESVVNFLAMATEQHVLRKHHCKIEVLSMQRHTRSQFSAHDLCIILVKNETTKQFEAGYYCSPD